jgi:hypothetical protein
MAKARLMGPAEMAEVDARLANMGKELYQLLEDYPSLQPPSLTYIEAVMFLHQQIYDEAMKLKRAAVLKEREAVATVKFDHIFTPGAVKEAFCGNLEKVASMQVS